MLGVNSEYLRLTIEGRRRPLVVPRRTNAVVITPRDCRREVPNLETNLDSEEFHLYFS
jgi:hypothetical protein